MVVVATVRALKHHGGAAKAELGNENLEALKAGLPNLLQHVGNMKEVYGLPVVVSINRFPTDTEAELALVAEECEKLGVQAALTEIWAKGGEGGKALAEEVVKLCEEPNNFAYSYESDLSIKEKLEAIAKKVYHADGVDLVGQAPRQLKQLEALGFETCLSASPKPNIAFSDNPALLGAPKGFRISVRNLKISAGAGFIVALTGDVMTMPGFGADPHVEGIYTGEEIKEIRKNAIHAGLKLVDCPIRHLGTEKAQQLYLNIQNYLADAGVEMLFNTECENIILEDEVCKGVLIKGPRDEEAYPVYADTVVIGTGRRGADWLEKICAEHHIAHKPGTVDIGVRVECRNEVMEKVNKVLYESKLSATPSPGRTRSARSARTPAASWRRKTTTTTWLSSTATASRKRRAPTRTWPSSSPTISPSRSTSPSPTPRKWAS